MAIKVGDLSQRRQLLLSRSAQQRADIVASSQALGRPLQTVDHGMQFVKNIGRHPGWIAGILIAVALIKPRRIVATFEAARVAIRTLGMVEPIIQRLRR